MSPFPSGGSKSIRVSKSQNVRFVETYDVSDVGEVLSAPPVNLILHHPDLKIESGVHLQRCTESSLWKSVSQLVHFYRRLFSRLQFRIQHVWYTPPVHVSLFHFIFILAKWHTQERFYFCKNFVGEKLMHRNVWIFVNVLVRKWWRGMTSPLHHGYHN